MDKTLKVLVILLVILSVISVAMAISFYMIKQYEKERREIIEDELIKIEQSRDKLKERFDQLNQDKIKVETEISLLKEEASQLKQDLFVSKGRLNDFDKQMAEKDKIIEGLKGDLEAARNEKTLLIDKIKELEHANTGIASKIEELEQEKTKLADQLKDAQEKDDEVQLQKVIVRSPVTEYAPPPKEGEILSLNKEFNFVILNLGRSDGTEMGATFNVKRDGRLIGRVQVEEVHDSVSAARIISAEGVDEFVEGDVVEAF